MPLPICFSKSNIERHQHNTRQAAVYNGGRQCRIENIVMLRERERERVAHQQ